MTSLYVSTPPNTKVSGKIIEIWKTKYDLKINPTIITIINSIREWGNKCSHANINETYTLEWAEKITLLKYLWYITNFIFNQKENSFNESYYLKTKINLSYDEIITQNINLNLKKSYNGTFSEYHGLYNEEFYKILCWKNYAHTWEDFIKKYSEFYFSENSFLSATAWNTIQKQINNKNISFKTRLIDEFTTKLALVEVKSESSKGLASQSLEVKLQIFHDAENIFLAFLIKEKSKFCSTPASFEIKIQDIVFK